MGEQLADDYSFPPRTKYPWDTWLDGTKWRIRSDIHFPKVKLGSMCRHIRTTAKERGKRVRIVKEQLWLNEDGSLITDLRDPAVTKDARTVDCLCLQAFPDVENPVDDNTVIQNASPTVPVTDETPELPRTSRPYVKR